MVLWIPIAIFSHLFWAVVNVGDKYIVSNRIKNPYVYLVWIMLFGIIAILLIPFLDFSIPDKNIFFLLIASSAFYFFGGFPYLKAMQQEDVTRINILWSLIPIFSLIIGWFAIDEKIYGQQFLAFAILILGALIASLHVKNGAFRFSKALIFMIIACAAYASHGVILRYVTQDYSFLSAFVWTRIFMFGFALLLLAFGSFRKIFKAEFKRMNRGLVATVFSISLADHLGILLNIWALSLGPVALVFAMEGFQAVFVFLMAFGLSAFSKIDLKEEINKKNVILKLAALVLMISGIVLLNLT